MIVITMENSGGELCRREVETEDDTKAAMIEMVEELGHLQDGDRFFIREKE